MFEKALDALDEIKNREIASLLWNKAIVARKLHKSDVELSNLLKLSKVHLNLFWMVNVIFFFLSKKLAQTGCKAECHQTTLISRRVYFQ